MIRTPSLRGRLLLVGITALALVAAALDVVVFLSLRSRLEGRTVETVDADGALGQLLVIETIGTVAVLAVALLALRHVASVITRPIDEFVRVADAIVAGDTGRRLAPSDADTELGRLATAFDRTVDSLDAALAEAREAQSGSRRFLSDAAHQLRTPMAGLRASAESLLRNPEGADRDALLANIARESVRASRLVDSLLQVARLDRGEALTVEDVDLLDVVNEEVDRAVALAPHLAIPCEVQGADFSVHGDPRALTDALANLLDNARQHARSEIRVLLAEELGSVRVVVTDDGPGVPEGREEEVFQRFVSLSGGGSGLGLAIARAVARSHGGDLTVSGASFDLLIPRVAV